MRCTKFGRRLELADRFKLATHKETRQLQVYTLTWGKKGPKLKAPKDDEQIWLSRSTESGLDRLTFQKWTMTGLTKVLSGLLRTPMLDQTGLTGTYDFTLEFAPDSIPRAGDSGPPRLNGAPVVTDPSIVTAVQEQLGLKLEEHKEPLEVVVIDYIDHASEN
jgi:uncharacterized protein (TIGR03435 family)